MEAGEEDIYEGVLVRKQVHRPQLESMKTNND
jgi:hypothetical protein